MWRDKGSSSQSSAGFETLRGSLPALRTTAASHPTTPSLQKSRNPDQHIHTYQQTNGKEMHSYSIICNIYKNVPHPARSHPTEGGQECMKLVKQEINVLKMCHFLDPERCGGLN